MRIKKYKSFNESKNKFPNIKTLDIDGFIVYLGCDAKSNDHLTFNMSDPDDIWLHTKGVPGSHMNDGQVRVDYGNSHEVIVN